MRMLFIPLGFGKLPALPVLSIWLMASIIALSVPFFKRVHSLDEVKRAAMEDTKYGEKVQTLLAQKCLQAPSAECTALRSIASLTIGNDKADKKKITEALSTYQKQDKQANLDGLLKKIKLINKAPEEFSDDIKALPGFGAVAEAHDEIAERSLAYERDHHFLSRATLGVVNLLMAEFVHGGWMHLIGNLIAFFALACVLENRVSTGLFLLIYFLGGSIGLLVQILCYHDKSFVLLGASANISAVFGACLVYFHRWRLRFLFSVIVYNKIIECPTWIMIPVVFVLGDVTGVLSGADGVAHLAHLSAFIAGAAIAFVAKQGDGMDDYLYLEERELHMQMKRMRSVQEKLVIAEKILSYNPRNSVVLGEAVGASMADADVNLACAAFVKSHFSTAALTMIGRGSFESIDKWMIAWPARTSSIAAMKGLDLTQLQGLAQRQLKKGRWFEALRFLDALCFYFPQSKAATLQRSTMGAMPAEVRQQGADMSALADYVTTETATSFKAQIATVLQETPHERAV